MPKMNIVSMSVYFNSKNTIDFICRESSSVSHPALKPEISGGFRVVIIDNNVNTYQEVIEICMIALGVDFDHAYKIALAVDHNGEADVFHGTRSESEEIASVIRTIGIEVQILPDGSQPSSI